MSDDGNTQGPRTERIDGRLHSIESVLDKDGKLVTTITKALKVEFRLEDLAQLIAGACVMALPISLTEEVWDLGAELSVGRTLATLGISLVTLAGFTWSLFYVGRVREYWGVFLGRVLAAYAVTFLVSFTFLFLFDKAPLDDLRVTLTRTILVALPACYAATAVDFVK